MALLDGPMRALAQNLTGKFGGTATLTRITADNYDTSFGDTSPTTATHTLNVVEEQSGSGKTWQRLNKAGVVQHGDLVLIVPAKGLSITPDPETDTVTRHGVTFALVDVGKLVPGDDDILYYLVLRN